MTLGDQFPAKKHPSRDIFYNRGDVEPNGQTVMLDQHEDPARARMVGFGSGNTYMGARGFQDEWNTSRIRPADSRYTEGVPAHLHESLANVGDSRVPTKHLSRSRGDIGLHDNPESRQGGSYTPSFHPQVRPKIKVGSSTWSDDVMVHEVGHAIHYDESPHSELRHPDKSFADQFNVRRGNAPDPLREGVADGYVDRYGGPHSKQVREDISSRMYRGTPGSHVNNTGYGTHYEAGRGAAAAWDDADRALYAGVRSHYAETGETTNYQRAHPAYRESIPSSPATDATVHHLMQTSPHANETWANTTNSPSPSFARPLTDVANEASRRHKDRELLSGGQFTQTSLLNELKSEPGGKGTHVGYTVNPAAAPTFEQAEAAHDEMLSFDDKSPTGTAWPSTMERNQYGEVPRTQRDFQLSLGVPKDATTNYAMPRSESRLLDRVEGKKMRPVNLPRRDILPR